MNLQELFKDLWRMIKENLKLITIFTLVFTLILNVGVLAVTYATSQQKEENSEEVEEEQPIKIGTIDLYADEDFENISLYPFLPRETIDEIHNWSKFAGDFSLTMNANSELDFNNIPNEEDEEFNPVESFLGLEDVSRGSHIYDEETGEYYFTVRVDPDTGRMAAVNSHYGVSDYLVNLDINDNTNEEVFNNNLNQNADSLLDVSFGMDPGGGRLIRFETFYNWQYGVNFPRSHSNERNFYVYDPSPFNVVVGNVSSSALTLNGFIKSLIITLIFSFFVSVIIVFIMNLFSKKLNYSFAYGWSSEDTYLKYNENDSGEQIAFDMLQSPFTNLAILSQDQLSSEIRNEANKLKDSNLVFVQDIPELSLGQKIEEFIIVIKRKSTDRNWYLKQRKHIKAFKEVSVKIIEI